MSTTIRDVARRAGVSIATVSRVHNGTSPVNEDKRRLVLEASDALGYAPNPAALSLRGGRTGGLGVLLPFVSGEFFSELLSGMDEAAQDMGQVLVVSTSHRRSDDFHQGIQALAKRVDGLVVMAPELDSEAAASIAATEVPVVFINTRAEGLKADVINFSNRKGARLLTRHLVDAGHRHIVHLCGTASSWDAQLREEGYREAMEEAGLDAVVLPAGYTREAGYAVAGTVIALDPRPTAVVAANDYCALGLLSAFHQAGVAVPDDVAVCGFDGLTGARYAVPPLTTVHVPVREIGSRAMRRLGDRLREGGSDVPFVQEELPVELMLRASTARSAG